MKQEELNTIVTILQANPRQLNRESLNESWQLYSIFCTTTEAENKKGMNALIQSFEQEPDISLENRICMVDGILFKDRILSQTEIPSQTGLTEAYNFVSKAARICGKTNRLTEEAQKYFYRGIEVAMKTPQKIKTL